MWVKCELSFAELTNQCVLGGALGPHLQNGSRVKGADNLNYLGPSIILEVLFGEQIH